ncbi:MAG: hypothetical protein KKD44_26370 [Proteobacteria bacterium]|nr:hypothetical protein [Pseudomonadota bacterium]
MTKQIKHIKENATAPKMKASDNRVIHLDHKWCCIPISIATKYKENYRRYHNEYWAVTENDEIIFFKRGYQLCAQSNINKQITDTIAPKVNPYYHKTVLIADVYIKDDL